MEGVITEAWTSFWRNQSWQTRRRDTVIHTHSLFAICWPEERPLAGEKVEGTDFLTRGNRITSGHCQTHLQPPNISLLSQLLVWNLKYRAFSLVLLRWSLNYAGQSPGLQGQKQPLGPPPFPAKMERMMPPGIRVAAVLPRSSEHFADKHLYLHQATSSPEPFSWNLGLK